MSQLVKTKLQANITDFKRFGACKGLSNKKTLYSTRSCVNWAFFGTRGLLKRNAHSYLGAWNFGQQFMCHLKKLNVV
jgi:hypothetical protein